jgi:hypothetical protein
LALAQLSVNEIANIRDLQRLPTEKSYGMRYHRIHLFFPSLQMLTRLKTAGGKTGKVTEKQRHEVWPHRGKPLRSKRAGAIRSSRKENIPAAFIRSIVLVLSRAIAYKAY